MKDYCEKCETETEFEPTGHTEKKGAPMRGDVLAKFIAGQIPKPMTTWVEYACKQCGSKMMGSGVAGGGTLTFQ